MARNTINTVLESIKARAEVAEDMPQMKRVYATVNEWATEVGYYGWDEERYNSDPDYKEETDAYYERTNAKRVAYNAILESLYRYLEKA